MKTKIKKAIERYLTEQHYNHLLLRAVLFDMDGVLFDSMKNHTLAWYKTMQKRNIPVERDEFYLYEGCTGATTINVIYNRVFGRDATEQEIKEIYQDKSRFFNQLQAVTPMPGMTDLLRKVTERGFIPVVVTGSGQTSLLEKLDTTYPGIFKSEYMVTAYDVKKGKPDPEPYLTGLQKAGVRANEAIVVENAPMGVKAGVAAGIFTVAVNTGPIPDIEFEKAGANLLFPNMPDFDAHFNELVNEFYTG